MINVLDPQRFWGHSRTVGAGQMGSEHKGDVFFSYWTHNPWYGLASLPIPTPMESSVVAAAPMRHSHPEFDSHVSWVVPAAVGDTTSVGDGVVDPGEEPHYEGFFAEASCIDDDDYASTHDPDSDDESLLDLSDPGGASDHD